MHTHTEYIHIQYTFLYCINIVITSLVMTNVILSCIKKLKTYRYKYSCCSTMVAHFLILNVLFYTVGISSLALNMGPNVTVATASQALGWKRRSVTWTAKARRALSVEVCPVCPFTRWRRFFLASGDVSAWNKFTYSQDKTSHTVMHSFTSALGSIQITSEKLNR